MYICAHFIDLKNVIYLIFFPWLQMYNSIVYVVIRITSSRSVIFSSKKPRIRRNRYADNNWPLITNRPQLVACLT
jgi:hypothetical protein